MNEFLFNLNTKIKEKCVHKFNNKIECKNTETANSENSNVQGNQMKLFYLT